MQLLPTSSATRCRSQRALGHLKCQSKFARKSAWFRLLTDDSLCKSIIRKLLIKDETRRLGSRAGASDIKNAPFFKTTQWALLRHMKPPIIPHQGQGIETPNFRNVKESQSVDIGGSRSKGVPLDSNLATPMGEVADPFEEFNSVTLHHDGDDHHHDSSDLDLSYTSSHR